MDAAHTTQVDVMVALPCPQCRHPAMTLEIDIPAQGITLYCPADSCTGELEDLLGDIITPLINEALGMLRGEDASVIADALLLAAA